MTTATLNRPELVQSIVEEVLNRLEDQHIEGTVAKNHTGEPTDEQLAQMNRFRPQGTRAYTKDEVMTVRLLASHNLLHFNYKAWTPNVVKLHADDYLGKAYEVDHDWWDSDRIIGFVYNVELRHSATAPDEDIDYEGFKAINEQIVKEYGYYQLILDCCVQKGTPIEDNIRFRRYSETSTGALLRGVQYLCPICQCQFKDDDCPHIPPTPWIRYYRDEGLLEPDEVAMIAPYILVDSDRVSVLEVSQVLSGNLCTTRILDAGLAEET